MHPKVLPTCDSPRVCKVCHEPKAEDCFLKDARNASGRGQPCLSCHNTAQKIRAAVLSDEERKAKSKATRDKRHGGPIQGRLEKQGGRCAACGATEPYNKRGWARDHDHETGQEREVICQRCNLALGHVRDSIVHLGKLIKYLRKWGKPKVTKFMDLDNLSQHERDLLDKALPYCKGIAEATGALPSQDNLRIELKCRDASAARIWHAIVDNKLVPFIKVNAPSEQVREENVIEKDKWNITLPKTRIHTLADLLKYFEVDTEIWEVKRFVVNKWEMGFIEEAVKDTTKTPPCASPVADGHEHSKTKYTAGYEPLYQVKAELHKKANNTVEHYAKENARLTVRVKKIEADLARERKAVKQLALNHAGYDDLLSSIKEHVNVMGDFSIPYEKSTAIIPKTAPHAVSEGHTEDAVLQLSDTHFGDVIRREDTSGFPEFDLVIAGNRFGYTIGKARQVLSLHRAMYPIKKLYIWLGGDIGNGGLHDSPNSNALFMPAQVHFSYHMLKFAIEELLTLTEPDEHGTRVIEEIVLLTTVGNHMRIDEHMPHKYQAQRTFDWLIYQFIIERFTGKPRISIRQEISPFIFENIRGHRHMFCHGMQVGFRNSPDAQNKSISQFLALARGLFDTPEWRRKNHLMGETFSRACIGDIHIPISFPRFKSNGSLNGQNELGVNWQLEPIPAGQQLWGVSDKHQETWAYFLECTQIQRAREDFNHYGTFAAEYAKRIGRC